MDNLFAPLPADLSKEFSEVITTTDSVRIERIVSHGHASPEDFWYDQNEDEWVAVLQGKAQLRFDGDDQPLEMGPGDFITIAAHQRHRVAWTTDEQPTVWLAVFYPSE